MAENLEELLDEQARLWGQADRLQSDPQKLLSEATYMEAAPALAEVRQALAAARANACNALAQLGAAGVRVRQLLRRAACARGEHVGGKSGFPRCVVCGAPVALRLEGEPANLNAEVASG